MPHPLRSKTQRIYAQVFQHPITHNLEWGDVRALLEALGEVEEQHNGNFKATMAGHSVVFQGESATHMVSADEVSQIRHFIRQGEEHQTASVESPHLLVVIDQTETRIFRTDMKGALPESITPHHLEGISHSIHSSHDFTDHSDKTKFDRYFEDISCHLKHAEHVLVFGNGTGSSSVVGLFTAWLAEKDVPLSNRIVGSFAVDESHMTDGQLLAKAREIYFDLAD